MLRGAELSGAIEEEEQVIVLAFIECIVFVIFFFFLYYNDYALHSLNDNSEMLPY